MQQNLTVVVGGELRLESVYWQTARLQAWLYRPNYNIAPKRHMQFRRLRCRRPLHRGPFVVECIKPLKAAWLWIRYITASKPQPLYSMAIHLDAQWRESPNAVAGDLRWSVEFPADMK